MSTVFQNKSANLELMVVNVSVLVCVKQVKGFLDLLFLLISQFTLLLLLVLVQGKLRSAHNTNVS